MKDIRNLRADEIEIRVSHTSQDKTKAMLLLYKDARCDMAMLDETFGIGNWQDKYEEIKGVLYCGIGVRASATAKGDEQPLPNDSWVWKWSNGIESKGTSDDDPNNKKGEASDAFKRAGFMWGIGRELYEWKNIWVAYDEKKDKYRGAFTVKAIGYDDKSNPKTLQITNSNGDLVYNLENGTHKSTTRKGATFTPKQEDNPPKGQNQGSDGKKTVDPELLKKRNEDNYRTLLKFVYDKLLALGTKGDAREECKKILKDYITKDLAIPLGKVEILTNIKEKQDETKTTIIVDTMYEGLENVVKQYLGISTEDDIL